MRSVATAELRGSLDDLITEVVSDAEPTIITGKNGKQAVLLPLDEFSSWQETLYLLSNPANAEHLRRSIAEARAGRLG